MPRDEDDRDANVYVSQLALKIQAVDSGQPHVKDQTTWPVRAFAAQEFLRRSECLRTQANRLQHALNGRAYQWIIINDEHCRNGCSRHSRASRWRRQSDKKARPTRRVVRSPQAAVMRLNDRSADRESH